MPYGPPPKLNLKSLMLLFALLSAAATMVNDLIITYRIQKRTLIENALESNSAYASKIAMSINENLLSDLGKLKYSAEIIGAQPNTTIMSTEADRLVRQDGSFNTVVITDENGIVIASKPDSLGINGERIRSHEAIQQRKEMVSRAYRSIKGNLIVFVSQPIWGNVGRYLGLVGGSIYLGVPNSLNTIISHHFYRDNSYIYLVDDKRQILSHPDSGRIGDQVGANLIVDALSKGQSGSMQASTSHEEEVLAGYANVPISNWGVVSQQPLKEAMDSVNTLLYKQLITVLPMSILGMFIIWWAAVKISLPLRQLSEDAASFNNIERILNIKAWYQEAWRIRIALLAGVQSTQQKIGTLDIQAKSDSLTGLANRRAFEDTLENWQKLGTPFSAISLDIDHFKRVNDTYGHDVGDTTLREVASIIKSTSRAGDLTCRVGGEEFFILLPETSISAATDAAERIRKLVSVTHIDPVGCVTVSLGVTCSTPSNDISMTLKRADELLYRAKQAGRNRVVADPPNTDAEADVYSTASHKHPY